MAETYPMPQYEYKDVITPERRQEYFEIEGSHLNLLIDLIQDDFGPIQDEISKFRSLEDSDRGKLLEALRNQYPQDEEEMLEERYDRQLTRIEQDVLGAFWGIAQNFQDVFERQRLKEEYGKVKTKDEREHNKNETFQINCFSAEWQNQVAAMIFALRKSEQGKEFLPFFWQTFKETGGSVLPNDPEEVRKIQNGVLGLVTAIEIFGQEGFETYRTYPDLDAQNKIDLWAKRGSNILATQIKSDFRRQKIGGERIWTTIPLDNLTGQEKREALADNILLTSAKEYGKLWRKEGHDCFVIPYRINLIGAGLELADEVLTGGTFPTELLETNFTARLQDEISTYRGKEA